MGFRAIKCPDKKLHLLRPDLKRNGRLHVMQ